MYSQRKPMSTLVPDLVAPCLDYMTSPHVMHLPAFPARHLRVRSRKKEQQLHESTSTERDHVDFHSKTLQDTHQPQYLGICVCTTSKGLKDRQCGLHCGLGHIEKRITSITTCTINVGRIYHVLTSACTAHSLYLLRGISTHHQ